MDNDMMENGKLIKDTAKDMKSLQMEASILVNTSKIKWMDKEDIPGQEEKLTKESGKTTWNMEVECGSIKKEILMSENGSKGQPPGLESIQRKK